MNRRPDKKRRERIMANWPVLQTVLLVGLAMSVIMPFSWGWPARVARGEMSWIEIARTTALVWACCLGWGEIIRRVSNRQLGEPLCKWIWQK